MLMARMDSWVQIQDRNRDLLLTRVLRAGDSYRAPNRKNLVLITGNAGGLEIQVDGKPIPPLGPIGAVRRDILLDPDRLASGN
ncbi:MAG: DUF4115 domain-containing protein [Alphaproteobacteria bacterium]|nr:DUF4115 domain-containing protein [Alphaproteobacteria bacterium]